MSCYSFTRALAKKSWLAKDLTSQFPEIKGLSPRNLGLRAILREPLEKLTWFHNLTLLKKLKTSAETLWYDNAAIENGASQNIMVIQIESDLYPQSVSPSGVWPSDLARQLPKDL